MTEWGVLILGLLAKRTWPLLIPIALVLSACGANERESVTLSVAAAATPRSIAALDQPSLDAATGHTHVRSDGNRYAEGRAGLPNSPKTDISLGDTPVWVVGAEFGDSVLWAVILENGDTRAYISAPGNEIEEVVLPIVGRSATPPTLIVDGERVRLLRADETQKSLSPPVYAGLSPAFAFLDDGDLLFQEAGRVRGRSLDPPPDARMLTDEIGRLLLLTGATERYPHGVIGDRIEASGFRLFSETLRDDGVVDVSLEGDFVFEGSSPIWTDLDGDGDREIILTRSNASTGAQLVVYDETGALMARSPAIGSGSRWRHQIAAAPFGPGGAVEVVDVLTPHIGGVVEFFRLAGSQLVLAASLPGYSSHRIGSRNLDMAAAADFDGDGRVELLIPDDSMSRLAAIRRSRTGGNGAEEVWSLELPAAMSTNLGVATRADGRIEVAVGFDNETLRLWRAP